MSCSYFPARSRPVLSWRSMRIYRPSETARRKIQKNRHSMVKNPNRRKFGAAWAIIPAIDPADGMVWTTPQIPRSATSMARIRKTVEMPSHAEQILSMRLES